MRRVWFLLFAFAFLAACGDGDDGAQAVGQAGAETSTEENVDPAESSVVVEEDADDVDVVDAFDDIPEVCRDLFASFLNDIEPIVSPIDWDNATLADFSSIEGPFTEVADQFDTESESTSECQNIELDEAADLSSIIAFAEDEAPDTVPFLNFLNGFVAAAGQALGVDDGAAAPTTGGLESCQDAIAWVESLAAQYDSITEAPLEELQRMSELATVALSCSPEELEVLNSPEIASFLEG